MDQAKLTQVNREVYRRYPEFKGITPELHTSSTGEKAIYTLTYNHVAVISDQKKIPRYLRVVVDAQGKIVRVTTSR